MPEFPTVRRLLRHGQILLLDVEISWLHDVVCSCTGISDAGGICGSYCGRQADESEWMESTGCPGLSCRPVLMCKCCYCGTYFDGNGSTMTDEVQAYLFENDDRFFVGWRLDSSFTISAVSAGISLLTAVGIVLSRILLPEEDGYELIPSERRY
jgi:hypothetical protein